jgi:ABC-type transporter Mla subunit MlaD
MAGKGQDPEQRSLVDEGRSLLDTASGLPVTLFRSANALLELPVRLVELQHQLNRTIAALESTGKTVERAADGITAAVSGVERVIDILDRSIPGLVSSAGVLSGMTQDLGRVAGEMAKELPSAVSSLRDITPEMTRLVTTLDGRLDHMDSVVTELSNTVITILDAIPGVRRVARLARPNAGRVIPTPPEF